MNTDTQGQKEFKRITAWAFIAGIAIVLAIFVHLAFTTFYPAPVFEDFCDQGVNSTLIDTPETCEEVGGEWMQDRVAQIPAQVTTEKTPAVSGYCDQFATCRDAYDDAREQHSRIGFIALAIIGIAVVGVGHIISLSVLSSGMTIGGILLLITTSLRFWNDTDDFLRLLIFAVALAALIWFAIRTFNSQDTGRSNDNIGNERNV